jgi:hypothetical protein
MEQIFLAIGDNMISDGDFGGLVSEIAAARERNISGTTYDKIMNVFEEMGWFAAKRITNMLVKSDRIPGNLYGYICSQWNEIKFRNEQIRLSQTKWQADAGCATPKQWSLWMELTGEVMLWHKLRLVTNNKDYVVSANIDYEQWLAMPNQNNKTWSPILDYVFESMAEPYTKRLSMPEFYTEYLIRMLDMLKTDRKKRTESMIPDKLEELELVEAEKGLKV